MIERIECFVFFATVIAAVASFFMRARSEAGDRLKCECELW